MAFEADIALVDIPYPLGKSEEEINKFNNKMLYAVEIALKRCGLQIDKVISREEFDKANASKDVNRYVRIRNADLDQLMLVSKEKYEGFDQFASARYATCSICGFENKTAIRCRFHPVIYKISGSFGSFLNNLGETLSYLSQKDTMIFRATSTSRRADVFKLYMDGEERADISGKSALTEVKNTYNIDINKLMDTIDRNIGIYYAPIDYGIAVKSLADIKKKHAAFMEKMEEKKNSGENREKVIMMINNLQMHNKQELSTAEEKVNYMKHYLTTEPIGELKFFTLNKFVMTSGKPMLIEEREFGRKIQ